MPQGTSKVYIQTNAQSGITRCEGGYSMGNIKDLSQWLCIDEGTGDRYNLCQSHYFDGGLYTLDGIPRYKLDGDKPVLRSDDEIAADRAAKPAPEPDAMTQTRLAVAELAQVVENHNTANQMAIAELAEALMEGRV